MRRIVAGVVLGAALLGGCKEEQASTPGAVKLTVTFQGFRPECVRVTAWDVDAPERQADTSLRPGSAGDVVTVAVFRGEGWGSRLRMRAEGFERGSCDAQGQALSGRASVAIVESDAVVVQDGKASAPVELALSALDADGDGYVSRVSTRPGTDCDDAASAVYPGAEEVCDDLDNNCDAARLVDEGLPLTAYFLDADGDGFGRDGSRVEACRKPEGSYVTQAGDCRDEGVNAASSHPGADELCDGVDNNCDPDHHVDEGFTVNTACAEGNICEGVTQCSADGRSTFCQGSVFKKEWHPDADGDGQGRKDSPAVLECTQPARHSADASDCDDGDRYTYQGADELCDAKDNDCNGAPEASSVCGGATPGLVQVATNTIISNPNWRSVSTWERGGVWIVGEGGAYTRKSKNGLALVAGSCGSGSRMLYAVWADPRSGRAYFGGESGLLGIQNPIDVACNDTPATPSNFTTRGLVGFPEAPGGVRLQGVGTRPGNGESFPWDGQPVTVNPRSSTTSLKLLDVHGLSESVLFAVGEVSGGQFPLYRFNPASSTWVRESPPPAASIVELHGVYVVNERLAFAVGDNGMVLRWDGGAWQVIPSDANGPAADERLRSVLAFGANAVYVVSDAGHLFRYNGTAWATLATAPGITLYDIAGTAPDDIWVVGSSDKVYHWPK
ncbi:putative metal-binding motif-containing protein [Myxococcaceae bacterium GXIMD 01537]